MSNLASIVFPLTAGLDTAVPRHAGRLLHAAFLHWLQHHQPELVARLHDKNYARPYALSDLHGHFTHDGPWRKIRQGQTVWFRLTTLEETFGELVAQAAARQPGPQLDDRTLTPGPACLTPAQHHYAGTTTFAALAAEVQAATEAGQLPESVTLRFDSATCFMENDHALPLPVPRYVFGYLLNKWQLASPFALPVEEVQHFVDSIHLAYSRLETQMVDLKKYRRVGFTGVARFALHPAMPNIYRQSLHLLAKFAYFSGVGSHTTMGMGQAWQLADG